MKNRLQHTYISTVLALCICLFAAQPVVGQKSFKTGGWSAVATGTIYINPDCEPQELSRILVFTGVHDVETNRLVIEEFGKIGVGASMVLASFRQSKSTRARNLNPFMTNTKSMASSKLKSRTSGQQMTLFTWRSSYR